jgi:DNA repair protein RadC
VNKPKNSITELKVTYGRKRAKDDLLKKPISDAEQVYRLFRDMQDETKEKLVCLHLSWQKEILSYEVVAIGTAHSVTVDTPGIFRASILTGASFVILVHNHPLGKCEPSLEDDETFKRLTDAGEILGIQLLDFIVIGEDGYYSYDEKRK